MKLSENTISVLKNFCPINQGITFKQGKILKTVSVHKNIFAKATIDDEISQEFSIYDLTQFLSVISLYKKDLFFEFDSKDLLISGIDGRAKTRYRTCDKNMIISAPEKELTMPDSEVSFTLSEEDFKLIMDAANILSSPHILLKSDGKTIEIVTFDAANDSAHTQSLKIDNVETGKCRAIFKTENIQKILSGSYDIKVSSKSISHFKNTKFPVEYFITTEIGSTFN